MKRLIAIIAMLCTLALFTMGNKGCTVDELLENQLVSEAVLTGPTMDGIADSLWDDVRSITTTLTVPNSSSFDDLYRGDQYELTMRSVYTDSDIYFLFEWTGDSEESLERESWYYNTTEGKWMQKPKKHPDDYFPPAYEDKFAVLWNKNITGFETSGCALVCHDPYKYTNNEGETGDMWHWKRDRTGPVNQVDDKWLSFAQNDNGRKNDDKDSGGYADNKQDLVVEDQTFTVPKYWKPDATEEYHWITAEEIADGTARLIEEIDPATGVLTDEDGNTLDPADFDGSAAAKTLPSVTISAFVGSRGDVEAVHAYSNGKWTLEIKRKLDTGHPDDDVIFDDLTKAYYFSFAAFDAAAIAHATPGPSGIGSPFFLTFE